MLYKSYWVKIWKPGIGLLGHYNIKLNRNKIEKLNSKNPCKIYTLIKWGIIHIVNIVKIIKIYKIVNIII